MHVGLMHHAPYRTLMHLELMYHAPCRALLHSELRCHAILLMGACKPEAHMQTGSLLKPSTGWIGRAGLKKSYRCMDLRKPWLRSQGVQGFESEIQRLGRKLVG